MIAYCWASGQIEFCKTLRVMPEGAIEIARGSERIVRDQVNVSARHGYQAGVLLVPGIPEAPDQVAAGDALELFLLWLKQRECKGFSVAIEPRDPFDYDRGGRVVSSLSVDDRCRAVAAFDKAACLAAMHVPGLQSTVLTAIHRRLRQLLKGEAVGMNAVRTCHVCGCTDARACEGGCSWVNANTCSRCVGKGKQS